MVNRFTQKAQNALNRALSAAGDLGHTFVGSEHLLIGLTEEKDSVAARLLDGRGVGAERVRETVSETTGTGVPTIVSPADITPRTKRILENSSQIAARSSAGFIGTEHLLAAILDEHECVAYRILAGYSISIPEIRSEIGDLIGTGDVGGARQSEQKKTPPADLPNLSGYGRDLTEAARHGKIDPIIGRDEETSRVIQILSRRTKNNPCLIGEPGVGKTAVVEGLAQRIADGSVPDLLRDKRILTLDISGMIAGAKYRGEFEERMKGVMEEASRNPDVILFIDEIHTLIGAGAAEGAVDAANILKPALARGELRIIGATTIAEYRRHIEKDSALERRFQSVLVGEPSEEETVLILTGLRDKYEAHHKLRISDEAIRASVRLSVRYINDRFLPDKAIDLIDEAASKLRIKSSTSPEDLRRMEEELERTVCDKNEAIKAQDFERAAVLRDREKALTEKCNTRKRDWSVGEHTASDTVTAEEIAEVVTAWTGIPVSRLKEAESERLSRLEETLGASVIGQDAAVHAVAQAIRRGRTGFSDPHRPIGSFLFLGPTGVGKTELSKVLAETLFGDPGAMIRLDMSEYMEKHSVSRLIGSPPGYVGHEEGGQLTERIRRKPYSVILFDEVEKAHPDVLNVLLQMMEDGMLTDAQGRRADCRNTVLILTSNIGASSITDRKPLGFQSESPDESVRQATMTNAVMKQVKETFRAEFLNRLDDLVIFRPLNREDLTKIVSLLLGNVEKRAALLGIRLLFHPSVAPMIARKGADPQYGARPMRRTITRELEDPLSEMLLSNKIGAGMTVSVSEEENRLTFSVSPDAEAAIQ